MKRAKKTLLLLVLIVLFVAAGFLAAAVWNAHSMKSNQDVDVLKAPVLPVKDGEGFYTVGNFRMQIEVLGAQTDRLIVGKNRLQLSLRSLDGEPLEGAEARLAVQPDEAAGSRRDSKWTRMRALGSGLYEAELLLTSQGRHVLAVDVETETLGHGDLVLDFASGIAGLKAATATPEGIAYYTCPMHGSIREAGPGQCPICSMTLIPVHQEQLASGLITVDAERRQLIGVKIGEVTQRDMIKTIRAVGKVVYDERRISNVSLKFDAWIGDLKANSLGMRVDRGQILFTVYSPELFSAQQEYLESRRRLASRDPQDSLVQAAKRRLMLWDISAAQVRALERRGKALEYLPIFAPNSGTVIDKSVVDGSYMKAGGSLLRIADLSTVWVDAEVYEADLPLISQGMDAEVRLAYGPQQTRKAKVDYVYPYLQENTRTARIRLELDNADGALKPDMYAEVRLQADLGQRLAVPEEAVLFAGESRVVFVDMDEDGKLKPVRVKTGQRVDGFIEIIEGLDPGERVVTSGNFLIAAEAKLRTGIDQW